MLRVPFVNANVPRPACLTLLKFAALGANLISLGIAIKELAEGNITEIPIATLVANGVALVAQSLTLVPCQTEANSITAKKLAVAATAQVCSTGTSILMSVAPGSLFARVSSGVAAAVELAGAVVNLTDAAAANKQALYNPVP